MQPVSCSRCTDCTWRTLFVRRKARRSIDVTAARSLRRSYRADEYLQFNMRFKRIGAIGGSLITTVCLLSGLMYYFNQDTCPVGTFPCKNTTMCLPQRDWCNQDVQCPYGDDESDCFADLHGVFDWFGINRESVKEALRKFVCNDTDTPVRCVYNLKCLATCQGYSEIPQNLSSQTMSIGLYDSSIERVPADAFASYSEIRLLYLDGTGIREIEAGAFANLTMLFWLSLDNNTISKLLPGHFTGLINLESLKVNKNRITVADLSDLEGSSTLSFIDLRENNLTSKTLKLPQLPALHEILLDENNFESIPDTLFVSCPALTLLSMQKNKIRTIGADTFQNLEQLEELNLAFNEITSVPLNVFQPLKNLTRLALGYNQLYNLPVAVLSPLVRLHSLDLEGISLETLEKNAFDVFLQLENVYFKKFHYCATYAPKVKWCRPSSDGVSSLSHLLDKILLRTAVWVISCVTCMGNVLVLWGRLTAKDENRVLTIIIRNLAVSDMLMGIYLFVIALADMIFRGNYNQVAGTWMSSWACTIVGVLAMTSLEVSVLILSFMSVERYMLIVAPLKGHRTMTPQTASASMIIIWIIGITLALVPVIHWRSSTRFYGVNGMCFPLHIDDPYLVGWEYSAFIFLGLNLTGLITIGYVYAGMFASIWKTRHACSLSVGDSEFAMRFFLIVLTDAACWAPIIILKIKAMMKYPIPADLHAWVVVFILPVNSAVNPLLYTFTTPKFRERLSDGWFGKVRNYVTRKSSTDDSQLSTTSNKNVKFSPSSRTNCDKKIPPLIGFNNGKTNPGKRDHIL
ncbi:leucine-rich repeat-containing G protein-coupled receptor 3 isoform X2 [Andrena cerasifolii]|uniref:leucine-rich repeat-containing G protein-coupled receptor 3 isoform X2 n=1 Tax=Andrena cerasifolii TaxID=2819439 RepID=UPI0040384986